MPISGLPGLPVNNIPISQRPPAGGTRQLPAPTGEEAVSPAASSRQGAPAGDPNRSGLTREQFVEPPSRQREIFSRQSSEDDPLSYKAKRALQAFADNSPTPSQQLGIELAGIDTYV